MRIGNGPRLVVSRPGTPARRDWFGRYINRGQAYDEWRERERARLRKIRRQVSTGDRKRIAWSLDGALMIARSLPPISWRRVDAHGRSHGPRIMASEEMPPGTRLRVVVRQEEDLHSRMSRMLKAAHRFALRTE